MSANLTRDADRIVPVLKIGRKRLLTQDDMVRCRCADLLVPHWPPTHLRVPQFMPLKHEQSRFCADLLAQGLRKHPT